MEKHILKLYQMIGDYFTGSSKRRFLYVIITLVLIVLMIASFRYKIIIEVDTLYWVFSSLVQALLALVALMGLVSIFKLQSLKSSEDQFLMIARENTYTYYLGAPPVTIDLLLEKAEKIIESSNLGSTSHLFLLKESIKDIKLSKKLVVDYAIGYTVYTAFVVLLSLLFLIFSIQISSHYFGIPALYIIFILAFYSLFLAVKGFSYSIR